MGADPEADDRELEADLPPVLALDAVDLLPDFDPVLVPPEPDRDEAEEREPVLFFAPEDLLEDDRLDDPPDDFADEDLEPDFDPVLDERDELDPDFEDLVDPGLDDPDFDDPELDDLDVPDLDDPDLEDFDEPDFDDDPVFEPEDFLVVGIFVSSGFTLMFFELRNACVRANLMPSVEREELQRTHPNLVLNSCA